MKKKIALYARTSTFNQNTENQIMLLKEYAKQNDVCYDLYQEKESTRKTRPVKQELLTKLRAGIYDTCVIVKLDRWARSSTELLMEIEELTKKGVNFISIKDNLDFNTATGRLHLAILSAFAEFERSIISDRTKIGCQRAKMQGKILGRPVGRKDSCQRKKSGYYLREAIKKKKADEGSGIYLPIEEYINSSKKGSPKKKEQLK